MTETLNTFCYNHPTRETALRCKKCERYICMSCAVGTPTGYMCKECVRERQKLFDTALWYDYLTGFGVAFLLSLIASVLVGTASMFIGFYIFFIGAGIAGAAGVFIANVILRVINKRRSRALFFVCAAGAALGAVPVALALFFFGGGFPLIAIILYAVIITPLVYTRVSGIQL